MLLKCRVTLKTQKEFTAESEIHAVAKTLRNILNNALSIPLPETSILAEGLVQFPDKRPICEPLAKFVHVNSCVLRNTCAGDVLQGEVIVVYFDFVPASRNMLSPFGKWCVSTPGSPST